MSLAYSFSFWAKYACVDSAVWHTALRLGLFDEIPVQGEGQMALSALADRVGASFRGTRVLVEPLVANKVLTMDEERAVALEARFASPLRQADFVAQLKEMETWWTPAQQLQTAVQTGEPIEAGGQPWDVLAHYRALFLMEPVLKNDSEEAAWIFDCVARNFLRTQVLVCASKVGLFSQLSDQPVASAALAEACETSLVGMDVLLGTLAHCGVLQGDEAGYVYHPEARQLLTPKSIASYGQSLGVTNMYWQTLSELESAVCHGARSLDLHKPELSGQFYLALARYNTSVFPAYFQIIRHVPTTLNQTGELVGADVLDVGAGSGVWGAAFAHAEPTLRVTFLDQPQVLHQTRRNVKRLNLKNETAIWGDDLLTADYGEDRFDVIILGQICHTQHPDDLPGLFQKLARSLRPGGYLVIAEQVLNERRDGPLDYLYFGVKEFLSTQGDILSLPEYVDLLEGAGFYSSQCYRLLGIDVIVGRVEGALPETLISTQREAVAV